MLSCLFPDWFWLYFWPYWKVPDFHQFTPNLHCYEEKKNQLQKGFAEIRSALLWVSLADKSQKIVICSYFVLYKTHKIDI